MKKWFIILLIVLSLYMVGCSNEEDLSSLSEYDMVYLEEKNDCQACI